MYFNDLLAMTNVNYSQFSDVVWVFAVPPQNISMTTDPEIPREGERVIVTCRVSEVRPAAGLTIQLWNKTTEIRGKRQVVGDNPDGRTKYVYRQFPLSR